jgi:hypothetical protein
MTGKAIGQARLEAIPWTRFSLRSTTAVGKNWARAVVFIWGSLRTVHGGDTAEAK